MPTKFSLKSYIPDGYYHVFNRGIDGREIFSEHADYDQFLSYIIEGLEVRSEKDLQATINDSSVHYKIRREASRKLQRKNYAEDIKLFMFRLAPNEFHLVLQQRNKDSMQEFMRSFLTRYSMYFNRKYKRKGSLFESAYKAIMISNDIQLLDLAKKLHTSEGLDVTQVPELTSSDPYYRGVRDQVSWLNTTLLTTLIAKRHPGQGYVPFISS